MKLIKKIFNEYYCLFPLLMCYIKCVIWKSPLQLHFNAILLFLVLLCIGVCLALISISVKHLFREKFALSCTMTYILVCISMTICIVVLDYVGWESDFTIKDMVIWELCIFPIYLLTLLFIKSGVWKKYIKE
jgi:hypothetical protein